MTTLKEAMDRRGLLLKDLRNLAGIDYSYARKHYIGDARVSAEAAVAYEAQLGIPRYELRPDLWSPAMFKFFTPSEPAAAGQSL